MSLPSLLISNRSLEKCSLIAKLESFYIIIVFLAENGIWYKQKICLHSQGSSCQRCKPFYVGEALNGGRCIPCIEYCNFFANYCIPEEMFKQYSPESFTVGKIYEVLTAGNYDTSKAICYNCDGQEPCKQSCRGESNTFRSCSFHARFLATNRFN